MLHGLIYTTTDGRPHITVSASDETLLLAQVPPSGHALLPVVTPPTSETFDQYVVAEEALVEKTAAVLTATNTPFVPGVGQSAEVTVAPFVPCTVLVNGSTYTLTEEDQVLTITSDVQASFSISVSWNISVWAPPITVLAQTWIPLHVTDALAVQAAVTDTWTSHLYALATTTTAVQEVVTETWMSYLAAMTAATTLVQAVPSLTMTLGALSVLDSTTVAESVTTSITGGS